MVGSQVGSGDGGFVGKSVVGTLVVGILVGMCDGGSVEGAIDGRLVGQHDLGQRTLISVLSHAGEEPVQEAIVSIQSMMVRSRAQLNNVGTAVGDVDDG